VSEQGGHRGTITVWGGNAEGTGHYSQHKLLYKGRIYAKVDDWHRATTIISRFHGMRVTVTVERITEAGRLLVVLRPHHRTQPPPGAPDASVSAGALLCYT
jgi:hypothetical protein